MHKLYIVKKRTFFMDHDSCCRDILCNTQTTNTKYKSNRRNLSSQNSMNEMGIKWLLLWGIENKKK